MRYDVANKQSQDIRQKALKIDLSKKESICLVESRTGIMRKIEWTTTKETQPAFQAEVY
jgi:hypothetical protein